MNRTGIETILREKAGDQLGRGIQALGQGKIRRWLLRRGMEFGSPWVWWGEVNRTRRDSYGGGPHEGIDFALGENSGTGMAEAGMEGLRVPVFIGGRVLWCFVDLVGSTLIVATDHRFEDFRLIVQYSHIELEDLNMGDRIETGTIIGKVKLSTNPKSITAPHLHLSIALLKEDLVSRSATDVCFTDWTLWAGDGRLVYLDPLQLLRAGIRDRWFLAGEAANSPIALLVAAGAAREDRLSLGRLLARSFPGVRTISATTPSDAVAAPGGKGLLVTSVDDVWSIHPGSAILVPSETRLSGEAYSGLVESIRILEWENSQSARLS